MDIGKLVNATKEIEVIFAGEVTKLTIYSLGGERLTAEQRQPLTDLYNESETSPRYAQLVEIARMSLPLLVKEWDVTWQGDPLPIASINETDEDGNRKYPIPDDFILLINREIREATADPTKPASLPTSLDQAGNVETERAVN